MATNKRLGLLHTSATLVPIFEQLCKAKLPGVSVFNLVDDSLIKDVIAHGKLRPQTARRVTQHVAAAEDAGADYIMVTCSSIGAAVETAATLSGVPVLRVDQPMADKAVATGRRVGVIATLPTTLKPTADLIRVGFNSLFSAQFKDWADVAAKEYNQVRDEFGYLGGQFMTAHDELAHRVHRTTFEDGSQLIVNYNAEPYTGPEGRVEGMGYLLKKGGSQ